MTEAMPLRATSLHHGVSERYKYFPLLFNGFVSGDGVHSWTISRTSASHAASDVNLAPARNRQVCVNM